MRLTKYLESRGESYRTFAERLDVKVTHQTVRRVALGGWSKMNLAEAIVRASQREPAPDGGTVTLQDLSDAAQEAQRRKGTG